MKNFLALFTLIFAFAAQAQEVTMNVTLNPAGSFEIKGKKLSGVAKQQKDQWIAQNIRLDMKSLSSGVELRDKHVQEYFETKKFSEAVLTKGIGKGSEFVGVLKVHGVESKISGEFEEKAKFVRAKFKTNLSTFKIKEANYMGVGVEDEVEVTVDLPKGK